MKISEIKIYEFYKKYLPTIDSFTFDNLKEQIKDEGILNPLTLWKKDKENILLDGHNRLAIAKELGINDLPVTIKEFSCDEDAEYWIICNQLNRRNLTERELKYFIGAKYNHEKQAVGGQLPSEKGSANFADPSTSAKIAEAYGISNRAVHDYAKDAKVIEALPEPTRQNFLSGGDSITGKEIRSLSKAIKEDKKLLTKIATKEGLGKALKKIEPKKEDALIQIGKPIDYYDINKIVLQINTLCFVISRLNEPDKTAMINLAQEKLFEL